jgi:hypothetical protein
MIIALCIVSASEIALAKPGFTYEWVEKNPNEFKDLLHGFGMDLNQPIELQSEIQHKNRMHQIVVCDRWVGYERTDKEWIESGYASREAKDKASNNRLLNDLYRMKGYLE